MRHKDVPLSKVRPNPFRNISHYPILAAKVTALRESIRATGFWGNIVGRERNGKVEARMDAMGLDDEEAGKCLAYGKGRRPCGIHRVTEEGDPLSRGWRQRITNSGAGKIIKEAGRASEDVDVGLCSYEEMRDIIQRTQHFISDETRQMRILTTDFIDGGRLPASEGEDDAD